MPSLFRNYFHARPLRTLRLFRTPSSQKAIRFWHISAPFLVYQVLRRPLLPHARSWIDMSRLVLQALGGVRLLTAVPLLRRLLQSALPRAPLAFFDLLRFLIQGGSALRPARVGGNVTLRSLLPLVWLAVSVLILKAMSSSSSIVMGGLIRVMGGHTFAMGGGLAFHLLLLGRQGTEFIHFIVMGGSRVWRSLQLSTPTASVRVVIMDRMHRHRLRLLWMRLLRRWVL